ncbi:hypothetical protein PI126_g24076, partial [Phytophthora idaei]
SSSGFQTVNSIVEFRDEDGASSGDSLLYHNVVLETELNDVEQQLVDGVDAAHIREYLHEYSKKPHIAGSQADYETALYTVEQFESFGIKTEIKEYYTLLSTPVRRRLAIVEPKEAAQELNLTEASVAADACTTDPTAEPPFLAYSPSGNITAPVMYANYGSQQDFQWLLDQGIDLKGKIALVRYGSGWASVLGAKYLNYEDIKTIPHLPSLPLSYGQAKHILKALKGRKAPASWQGGLSFPDGYHIGDDSSAVVNLDLEMDNSIGPIWDIIGTIEGSEEPEKQVILGNHRDAWVCGAIDPNSGASDGSRSARSYLRLGMLRSTEYVEENADKLRAEAIAYLNVDTTLGPLAGAGGSPSIAKLLFQTANAIPANAFGGVAAGQKTLYQQWLAQTQDYRRSNATSGTIGPDHLLTVLGTASDFSAFCHHLGVVCKHRV